MSMKKLSNFSIAKKVILCPGPYANNIFLQLGFQIDMEIWELPSVYFNVTSALSFPTWFVFQKASENGTINDNLYYGFPESEWELNGTVKISPDFVQAPIRNPSQRTGIPDPYLIERTVDFVRRNTVGVDWENPIVSPYTCLATMVPDGDFVLDYAPPSVPYNHNIVVFAAGWGFKFVPIFGKILSDLALFNQTDFDISYFKITRKGVLVVN